MSRKGPAFQDRRGRVLVVSLDVAGLRSPQGTWLPLPAGFSGGDLTGWDDIDDAALAARYVAEARAALGRRR